MLDNEFDWVPTTKPLTISGNLDLIIMAAIFPHKPSKFVGSDNPSRKVAFLMAISGLAGGSVPNKPIAFCNHLGPVSIVKICENTGSVRFGVWFFANPGYEMLGKKQIQLRNIA